MPPFPVSIENLPGGDLVEKGINDLKFGTISVEALLLIVAAPALGRLGVQLPAHPDLESDAELLLYRKLQEEGRADPYSAYNAFLRLIVSFTRGLGERVRVEGKLA